MRDEVKASASGSAFYRATRRRSSRLGRFRRPGSGGNGASRRATRPLRRAKERARVSRVSRVSRPTTRASSSVSFETRLSDSSLCVFVSAAAVSAAAVSAAAVSANARSSASSEIAKLRQLVRNIGPPPKTERLSAPRLPFPSKSTSVVAGWSSGTGTSGRGGNTPSYAESAEPATHEGGNRRRRRDDRRFFGAAARRISKSRHPELACAHAADHRKVARAEIGVFRSTRISRSFLRARDQRPTAGHSSSGEAVKSAASAPSRGWAIRARFRSRLRQHHAAAHSDRRSRRVTRRRQPNRRRLRTRTSPPSRRTR